jgi:hypothetical protein
VCGDTGDDRDHGFNDNPVDREHLQADTAAQGIESLNLDAHARPAG